MSEASYLQPSVPGYWQWEDNGVVVAIPGGATIAYRVGLEEILSKMEGKALPPFGALLLAIVAMNPDPHPSLALLEKIWTTRCKRTPEETEPVLNALRVLTKLPSSFRKGPLKIQVLATYFDGCHNSVSASQSAVILQQLASSHATDTPVEHEGLVKRDLATIALQGKKFPTVQSILDAIAPVPSPPEPLLMEQPPPGGQESQSDFVTELTNDPTTFPVGSLVRWLWGGLNIPVHSALPSQQPLGGISDITNKGQFDKLLISEFAHDDIMFMSRLANNEALYIHREIPPSSNDLERLILIDATLKNWGNPKTIAFGVAIAISRHPKTDIACRTFVLGKTDYQEVLVDSREHLVEALQWVDGGLHPAISLGKFLADRGTGGNQEIVFITERSTLREPALLKVLHEQEARVRYQVLTDVAGQVEVFRKQGNSRNLLQKLEMPLNKLWSNPPRRTSEPSSAATSLENLPILFRAEGGGATIQRSSDGQWFQIDSERSLFRLWNANDRLTQGWDLLAKDLPFKTKTFEIGLIGNEYVVLLFNVSKREICLLNTSTGAYHKALLPQWQSTSWPSFLFRNDRFCHHNGKRQIDIFPDGRAELSNAPDLSFFQAAYEERKAMTYPAYRGTFNVFKNIYQVFINKTGQLVFNIHALQMVGNNTHLKLAPAASKEPLIMAERNENVFRFPDGSYVEVNRSGMILLRSSDRLLPVTYVPLTIDSALGAATSRYVTGNTYYEKTSTEPATRLPVAVFYQKFIATFITTIQNANTARTR